jgi:signal transduction histidine kinase
MGYTDILLERLPAGHADRAALEEIRKATARGAVLTRQLLAFSRTKETRPTELDLNRVLAEVRDILARIVREDMALVIRPAHEAVAIRIDPHDLEQVILNLVLNARDALPSGVTIHVEVSRRTMPETGAGAVDAVPAGEYARLRVRDDGEGMTPDVQSHLFEPFFTTKEVGQGAGLGLAFVYGVVRQRKGFITVDSAPGRRTTFDMYFPLVSAAEEGPAELLARAGYRVLEAGTPGAAWSLFEQHSEDVDLLVSDIVMPEMHGRRSRAASWTAVRGGSRTAFLAKPFSPGALVAKVDELLASVPERR